VDGADTNVRTGCSEAGKLSSEGDADAAFRRVVPFLADVAPFNAAPLDIRSQSERGLNA
jgi:hypothetical protein